MRVLILVALLCALCVAVKATTWLSSLSTEEQTELDAFIAKYEVHKASASNSGEGEDEGPGFGADLTLSPLMLALREKLQELMVNPLYTEGLEGDQKALRLYDLLFLEKNEDTDGSGPIVHASEDVATENLISPEAHAALARAQSARSLQSLPTMSPKRSLSPQCANDLCDMLQYQLSCKAMNFGFTKICAQYFLGNLYACTNFPPPSEFFNAPSVCLNQILGFFASLTPNAPVPLSQKIAAYLNPKTFTSNVCERRCYQLFENASNTFYNDCYGELLTYNKTYPLVYAISNFQQFRNQACSKNETGSNCYVATQSLQQSATSLPLPPGFSVNPFAFNCSFVTPALPAANNKQIMSAMCGKYAPMGCCAGQGMQMIVQNPVSLLSSISAPTGRRLATETEAYLSVMTGAAGALFDTYESLRVDSEAWERFEAEQTEQFASDSGVARAGVSMLESGKVGASLSANDVVLYPPCMLQYWKTTKCPVKLDVTCNEGSTATQTTLEGWFLLYQMYNPPTVPYPLPNVYDKSQTLMTQGVIVKMLSQINATFARSPYQLTSPLKVMITGYQYYSATGAPLAPAYNGSTADYKGAAFGNFSYMITLQNVNANQANYVENLMRSQSFAGALSKVYGGNPQAGKFPQVGAPAGTPKVFSAEPADVSHSAAPSRFSSLSLSLSLALSLVGVAIAFVL